MSNTVETSEATGSDSHSSSWYSILPEIKVQIAQTDLGAALYDPTVVILHICLGTYLVWQIGRRVIIGSRMLHIIFAVPIRQLIKGLKQNLRETATCVLKRLIRIIQGSTKK